MKDYVTGGRLPSFTDDEKAMMKGSYDFIGLNHYTSGYVYYTGVEGIDYTSDGRYGGSPYNATGHLIGEQAESTWLFVCPEGFRAALNWVANRYGDAPIMVFENGVSVPGENSMPLEEALNDTFRINYY